MRSMVYAAVAVVLTVLAVRFDSALLLLAAFVAGAAALTSRAVGR